MKYLKKFNEDYEWQSPSSTDSDEFSTSSSTDNFYSNKLPIGKFERILADLEQRLDTYFDDVTEELVQLGKRYPYITSDESYKDLYSDFIEKWQEKALNKK